MSWLDRYRTATAWDLQQAENRILAAVAAQGALIMKSIQDFASATNANFAKIQAGITHLDDLITAFQNSPGTLSDEDQAALDSIVAASSKLADAANAEVVPAVTA